MTPFFIQAGEVAASRPDIFSLSIIIGLIPDRIRVSAANSPAGPEPIMSTDLEADFTSADPVAPVCAADKVHQ